MFMPLNTGSVFRNKLCACVVDSVPLSLLEGMSPVAKAVLQ